jgi:hypothetical protein
MTGANVNVDGDSDCVASSLTGSPISSEDWTKVDDAIYVIE